MKLLLAEMTRLEAREAFDQGAMVVLPTAAIEQHGPHLPLVVDTCVVEAIARQAAERAAREVPVVVAPTVHYGSSHHHLPFAGTMSLSVQTYMAVINDLIRCVAHHGGKKMMLLNGHGGNENPNEVVAQDLANQLDLTIGTASYWTLARPALDAEGATEGLGPSPGHAGDFETSCLLALRPDLVHLDQRGVGLPGPSSRAAGGPRRVPLRAAVHQYGAWEASGGTTDDAQHASAEHGQRILEITTEAVAHFLVDFYRA